MEFRYYNKYLKLKLYFYWVRIIILTIKFWMKVLITKKIFLFINFKIVFGILKLKWIFKIKFIFLLSWCKSFPIIVTKLEEKYLLNFFFIFKMCCEIFKFKWKFEIKKIFFFEVVHYLDKNERTFLFTKNIFTVINFELFSQTVKLEWTF